MGAIHEIIMFTKPNIKISRRSFLLGLAAMYIGKNYALNGNIPLFNEKKITAVSINSNLYQWILDKDEMI